MIDADTLAELKDWVRAGRRQAEIQLGNPLSPDYENIHVFDADLNEGQDVQSVAEINLIARKRRKIEGLKKRIEKLELEIWQYETGGETGEHLPEVDRG